MTIESEDIIREMLENDGIYPVDLQVEKIYEYLNVTGRTLYAVFMERHQDDMMEDDMMKSPYVSNPVLLWSQQSGLTERGREIVMKKQLTNKEKSNE